MLGYLLREKLLNVGNYSYCFYSSLPNATFVQEMEVVIPDLSKMYSSSGMVESKSVGTFSPFQKQDSQRGLFVDRGVGSPRLVKSSSSSAFSTEVRKESPETKVCVELHLSCKVSEIMLFSSCSGCSET